MSLYKKIKHLLKLLDSDPQNDALTKFLAEDEEMQQTWDTITSLQDIKTNESFGPYFADRILNRIRSEQGVSPDLLFFQALRSYFTRLAWVAAVTAVFLIALNVFTSQDPGLHTILTVPQVTVQDLVEPSFFEEAQ